MVHPHQSLGRAEQQPAPAKQSPPVPVGAFRPPLTSGHLGNGGSVDGFVQLRYGTQSPYVTPSDSLRKNYGTEVQSSGPWEAVGAAATQIAAGPSFESIYRPTGATKDVERFAETFRPATEKLATSARQKQPVCRMKRGQFGIDDMKRSLSLMQGRVQPGARKRKALEIAELGRTALNVNSVHTVWGKPRRADEHDRVVVNIHDREAKGPWVSVSALNHGDFSMVTRGSVPSERRPFSMKR